MDTFVPLLYHYLFFEVIMVYLIFKPHYGRKAVFIITQNFKSYF